MRKKLNPKLKKILWAGVPRFALSTFCMALSVGLSLLTPLLLAETIDAVLAAKRPLAIPGFLGDWVNAMGGREFLLKNLWLMALGMVLISVLGGAFQYLRGKLTAEASEQTAKDLRDTMYSHIQSMPYREQVAAQTGDLIQRATSDVETVRRFLSQQLVEIFRTVLMVVVATAVMFSMHVKMTLVSFILVPPLFLLAWLFFRWVQKLFLSTDAAEGKMSAVLQENLTGVRVVRAFGREAYEVEKFTRANDDLHDKARKLSDLMAAFWPSCDLLSMAQQGITLVYGVALAARGEMLVGELTVFFSYVSMLLWPIRQLGRILADLGKAKVSLDRIGEVLDAPAEDDLWKGETPDLNGDIVFDQVSFSYNDKTPVLTDVSFTAGKGETIAILGATGSGKSTIVSLLQRLYEPSGGEIRIGGVPIGRIQKAHLRSRVGLVLQEPFLYSRTIEKNIVFARPEATDEEIGRAARIAAADGFISRFDKGYETIVGERGVTLSGGQKQRIAIARTVIRDNDILIFDDSLSAVDTETDAAIRAALKEARGDKTTFIISHRLTTLSQADKILVISNGRIGQSGTHEELTAQDGLYRRVWRIQSALEEELSTERA